MVEAIRPARGGLRRDWYIRACPPPCGSVPHPLRRPRRAERAGTRPPRCRPAWSWQYAPLPRRRLPPPWGDAGPLPKGRLTLDPAPFNVRVVHVTTHAVPSHGVDRGHRQPSAACIASAAASPLAQAPPTVPA